MNDQPTFNPYFEQCYSSIDFVMHKNIKLLLVLSIKVLATLTVTRGQTTSQTAISSVMREARFRRQITYINNKDSFFSGH